MANSPINTVIVLHTAGLIMALIFILPVTIRFILHVQALLVPQPIPALTGTPMEQVYAITITHTETTYALITMMAHIHIMGI